MGTVHIEFLSWLADTTDVRKASESAFEEELGDCRTVEDLLVRLAGTYPRFQKSVFDIHGLSLSGNVAVFHNGRQIEMENGLKTALNDGDTLVFVPVIAGG